MKRALSSAVLLSLVMWSHGLIAKPCCKDNEQIQSRGYCPNATERISIGCKNGHFLLKDIIVKNDGLTTRDTPDYIFTADADQFCVGQMLDNSSDARDDKTISVAVVCFQGVMEEPDQSVDIDVATKGILTLVSTLFLVLTLSVYAFVPRLRDLQGKCIMCMCASMAIGFLTLGIMQVGSGFQGVVCSLNGFIMYFWMMATFFWMNVVSINMFRSVTQSSYLRKTETRQFLYYSLYAWGCTVVFLIAVLVTNFVEGEHLRPGFSTYCWFSGAKSTWVFFYGPLACLIAANVLLFVLTSLRLWKTSKNYEVSTLNRLKYTFLLYLKLFIVMGLSWIFEVASYAHAKSHIIWVMADIFNCLQGVVFFLLLVVFRRRALLGLAERGVGGAPMQKLLQKLSKNNEENDSIIESEQDAAAASVAPYNVNLN